MNLAPQLNSCTTAKLGTGTEWEKRRSALQNTFVPPRCWPGLGLFSASQGSEHPRGLAHPASHNWWRLWNIWAVENALGIRMLRLPASQPAPGPALTADSQLCCLDRRRALRLGTPVPALVLYAEQRQSSAGTRRMPRHVQKAPLQS